MTSAKDRRRPKRPREQCYLIHFDRKLCHAGHYLGSSRDLAARLEAHRTGRGSPLLLAALAAGICWDVVRTWPGGRAREKALKRQHNSRKLCPVCSPPCRWRRAP